MFWGHMGAGLLEGLKAYNVRSQQERHEADAAFQREHQQQLLARAIAGDERQARERQEDLRLRREEREADRLFQQQSPQWRAGEQALTRQAFEDQATREIAERLAAGDTHGARYLGIQTRQVNPFEETPEQRATRERDEWTRRNAIEHQQALARLNAQRDGQPRPPAPGSPEEYAHLLFATRRQMEQTAANQLSMAENADARAAIHAELDDRADDFVSQRYGVPTQRELREKLTNFHSAAVRGNPEGWQRIGAMYARAQANPVALHKFLAAARQYAPQWQPPPSE